MTKYVYIVEEYDRWGYYYGDNGKVFWGEELADAFKEELIADESKREPGDSVFVLKCELVGFDSNETSKL